MRKFSLLLWLIALLGYTACSEDEVIQKPPQPEKPDVEVVESPAKKEREALIAFYNALDGPNWARQTNWCSDKPLEEWEGVSTDNGHVCHLDLRSNNLTGQIPESLFELKGLKNLMLGENHLVGTLSPRFAELTDLKYLDLSYNNLEGNVPVEWVALTNLETCNLFENRLSGVFPKEIYAMPNFDNAFRRFVQVQQFGYGFIFPATEGMINIGENLFLHPDGYALEYRMKDLSVPTEKDMQKILREAYKALPDDYDFVYFICNAESMPCSFAGRSYRVKFNISGLGYDSFDVSADYGSAGRLKDAIIITSRSSIYSSGPLLHETFHYWGAMDIGQWRTNDEGPSVDYAHWGVSSVNGTVGGFDLSTLQRNVDGNPKKYRAGCSSVVQWGNPNPMTFSEAGMSNMYYPPLELYMMGLIPASEVEPIHVFTGVTAQTDMWDDGTFFAEGEQIVTIEDIIKKHGPRVPDYTQSQKNFRGLIVVITKDPVADIYWEQIIPDIKNQEKQGAPDGDRPNFYQATGGRATLTLSGVTRKQGFMT